MAGGQGRNTTNGRNGGRRITNSGDRVERSDLSIMDDIESDDESHTTNELVTWIKGLQMRIRKMEGENNGLKEEIDKMKADAKKETSELLGHAKVQCERDERTYKRINTLVVEKVFSFKKFITSQKDLDDFSGESSLGMIVMDRMKLEGVDRLSFWNAYKEIVADAIANRRTTITNDLKKVVMRIKANNKALVDQGKLVPIHVQLPTLAKMLKLRQSPRSCNNTSFTFIVEQLAGAVIGQQKWKTGRCYTRLSECMSVSNEAVMLLVLENQYNMWREAETTRDGWGRYTENGPNKKFCGWSNDGMRRYNQLIAEVRDNQNKQYSKEVENSTFKTLAERYKKMLGVRRKNSRKCRHRVSPEDMDDEEQEDDDDSIVPEDELMLLAMEPV